MKPNRILLLVSLCALFLVGVAIRSSAEDETPISQATTEAAATDTSVASDPSQNSTAILTPQTDRSSGLPTVSADRLPIEAIETLILIDDGGPYPFDRDDLTFQNREGILPDRPPGHYREYTVVTPGEDDRGARRIVTGDDGERYYTDDHYSSFRAISFPENSMPVPDSG